MSYKRKTYLIDPKFQLKFSLYVCIILFISSLAYPYTIYDIISHFTDFTAKNSPEIATLVNEKKHTVIWILVLCQIGYTALVFIICIFFSHKIAGPIYKTRQYLISFRKKKNKGKILFRKDDYFHELADEINKTFDEINENHKKDFIYLSEISEYIENLNLIVPNDKKTIIKEIIKKLNEIQNRFSNII